MSDLTRCIDFLRRLIRTPGLPGEEGDVAALMRAEMEALGYDEVRVDEAGNVLGLIRGRGEAPAVMLNTHLDHVDVGDADSWSHPPYGGDLDDGTIWGRGAADIKGPLAAQVYGAARLKSQDVAPPGDVWVTAVVQEEIGGVGARHLLSYLRPRFVVIGEPSGNTLRRGHRGRSELILQIRGRSAHASVPHNGVNPYEVLAGFLQRLPQLRMPYHADLGHSSVAPTLIRTDQSSGNVIPGQLWLTCDWRNVPKDSAEHARKMLQEIAAASLIEGATAAVSIPVYRRRTYTGMQAEIQGDNPAYILAAGDPAVLAAQQILGSVPGLQAVATQKVGTWRFATDGGHFAAAGLTCIGFGPGDEMLAHTNIESVQVAQLEQALAGYEALALRLAAETG